MTKKLKKLKEFFKKEDLTITKETLAEALRLFMSIILYREKDKENKIRLNKNNIVGYLKEQDLWEKNNIKIKDEKFNDNLSKIKSINITIKEIMWLYCYLTDNKDDDLENDIKEKYKKYLEDLRKKEKEKKMKKKSDEENEVGELESQSDNNKSGSKSSSKSGSRSSSKSGSRSSSRSGSRSSSRSGSKSSSKSGSRSSSRSGSRSSSKSGSKSSSKSGSRKNSVNNGYNSEDDN
jgi:DNA-binding protein H-NS